MGMDGWVCGLSKWYYLPFRQKRACGNVPVCWTRATSITIVLSSTTPILSQTFQYNTILQASITPFPLAISSGHHLFQDMLQEQGALDERERLVRVAGDLGAQHLRVFLLIKICPSMIFMIGILP